MLLLPLLMLRLFQQPAAADAAPMMADAALPKVGHDLVDPMWLLDDVAGRGGSGSATEDQKVQGDAAGGGEPKAKVAYVLTSGCAMCNQKESHTWAWICGSFYCSHCWACCGDHDHLSDVLLIPMNGSLHIDDFCADISVGLVRPWTLSDC